MFLGAQTPIAGHIRAIRPLLLVGRGRPAVNLERGATGINRPKCGLVAHKGGAAQDAKQAGLRVLCQRMYVLVGGVEVGVSRMNQLGL